MMKNVLLPHTISFCLEFFFPVEVSVMDIMMGKFVDKKSCRKIALEPKENEASNINLSDRTGLFFKNIFKFLLSITQPREWQGDEVRFEVYLTSKKNFYGVGRNHWYDGEVAYRSAFLVRPVFGKQRFWFCRNLEF